MGMAMTHLNSAHTPTVQYGSDAPQLVLRIIVLVFIVVPMQADISERCRVHPSAVDILNGVVRGVARARLVLQTRGGPRKEVNPTG